MSGDHQTDAHAGGKPCERTVDLEAITRADLVGGMRKIAAAAVDRQFQAFLGLEITFADAEDRTEGWLRDLYQADEKAKREATARGADLLRQSLWPTLKLMTRRQPQHEGWI